jgi:hypothetical protein
MPEQDRMNKFINIGENEMKLSLNYETARVMREETELLLNKQRTIFHMLTATTLVTLIITFSI